MLSQEGGSEWYGANMNRDAILQIVQSRVPALLALYAFGSRIQGTAGPESDLDLAVLVEGYADPMALWTLAGDLADVAGCPVDLLDLRAASTVMQYQIITTGQRWWTRDSQAALFEAMILSEKTALDSARAALLDDIQKEGKIYGR
jgi:predicted nucleotidyltransferase